MSKKNTGPLADEGRAAREEKQKVAFEEMEKSDLRWLISDRRGRRIASRFIFDDCGVLMPGWSNSADIHKLAGIRTAGSNLLFKLEDFDSVNTRKMVDEWFGDRAQRLARINLGGEEET